MSVFDWVALGVLAVSVLLGLLRGFVFEVLSLAGWVVAFWAAQWFAPQVAPMLPMSGAAEPLRYAGAFVLVFIAAIFAAGLVAWLIKKMISAVGLRPADRALGGLFGLLRSLVILLALAVVINMTPMKTAAGWTDSYSGPFLNAGLSHLKPALPAEFAKYLP